MIIFYLLVSVVPFVRHPFWSLFIGSLTIVKIAGLICVGYALLYSNVRRTRPDYFRTWQARLSVLLCVMGMASYVIIGSRVPFEVSPFLSYVSFLMFFYVTLNVVDSASRLRWVMLVAAGSMAYASIHVLREWQNSGFDYGYRPGWVTGDPNYFSLSALLGLPFAFYLMRTRQPTWERNVCIGCLGLTLVGFALAASRGGLLGLAASVMVVAWRSKHRIKVMAAAVALLIPLMVFSPSSPIGRLLNPTYSDRDSSDSRLLLWTAGLKMMRQHPFTGVGVGNYKQALDTVLAPGTSTRFSVAHNTYIQVGAELGIVGLAVFVGIILMTLRSTQRIRRAARRARVPLIGQAAEAIQVGLVGFSVSITFVSAEYHKFFWLVVFLTCCLPALLRPKHAGGPWWARRTPRGASAPPVAAPPGGPAGDSERAPGPVGSPSP